jgi:glycosyltransferase involved in cell wall biosynthesis
MSVSLDVLFVESYYGGSHAAFADGLIAHSRHRIDLISLPATDWRWRTRVAAFELARLVPDPGRYDLVFVTDLIDLADLLAVWGPTRPAVLLYVHESQLTYPHPKDRNPDMNTAIRDIKNCLVADRVLFNSSFHREGFLSETEAVEARIPSEQPLEWRRGIAEKSAVLYPGIDTTMAGTASAGSTSRPSRTVPRILWNHRWEYDKRPGAFFRSLSELDDEDIPFELVVLGENPRVNPVDFQLGRERLEHRIVRWGYADSKHCYWEWLRGSDIVVSTAIQENFGIAMVEAIYAGCTPVLPRKLSYPEVVPERFHDRVLYSGRKELVARLRSLLLADRTVPIRIEGLAESMEVYGWKRLAAQYDSEIERVVRKLRFAPRR